MPIYEYECPKCGRFEALQGLSEKPLKAKPDCEDPKCPCSAQRVISTSSFHLKGSGWYKTDYTGSGSSGGSSKSSTTTPTSTETDATSKGTDKKSGSDTKESAGAKPCGPKCGCH